MEKPRIRTAAVMHLNGTDLEIPCVLKIWQPLDALEDFKLAVTVDEKASVSQTELMGESGWAITSAAPHQHIQLENVFIGQTSMHRDANHKVTGLDIQIDYAEKLSVSNPGPDTPASHVEHCVYYLSRLDYGTRRLGVQWSYLGGGEPCGDPIVIACPEGAPFKSLKLTRHYQDQTDKQLKRTTIGSQAVLEASKDSLHNTFDSDAAQIYAKDVALLLSLAARHPVAVIGELLAGGKWHKETYWQPLGRQRADQPEEPLPLIEESELANFLTRALESWQVLPAEKRDKLRYVLAALNPWRVAAISSRFMSMFAALEGLTDRLPVDPARDKIREEAKGHIIAIIDGLGLSESEAEDCKSNISNLWLGQKTKIKLANLLTSLGVSQYGLWPIEITKIPNIGKLPGLTAIRNHIAHGNLYAREQQKALACATESLTMLLERVALSMLGYLLPLQVEITLDPEGKGGNWRAVLTEYQKQLKLLP